MIHKSSKSCFVNYIVIDSIICPFYVCLVNGLGKAQGTRVLYTCAGNYDIITIWIEQNIRNILEDIKFHVISCDLSDSPY